MNSSQDCDNSFLVNIYKLMRRDAEPELYFLTAVLSLLFVIGTIGNIIVICVFSRSFIKHTSTYFILTLAIVDLIICTTVLPGVLIKNWSYPFREDALCKVWEFIRMSTIPVSALTLMAIGFDRFYLICMTSEGPLSTSLAKLAISAILLCGVSLGLPPMLGVGVYQECGNGEIIYFGLCMPNYQLISQESLEEYWKVVVGLICAIFLFLVIVYTLIFIKVYKQNQKWNVMKRNKILPVVEDAPNCNKSNPHGKGWARLRRIARVIPARDQNGRIFFVRIRTNQVNPPLPRRSLSNASNGESDVQGPGDSGLGSTENSRVSRSPSLNDTNKLTESTNNMANRQEYTYGRQRKAHIKTAKVLCIVTAIYIISYSPPLLISAGFIPNHMFLFYSYFLHSAANPVVYSFMNKKFRSEARKLLHCQSRKHR